MCYVLLAYLQGGAERLRHGAAAGFTCTLDEPSGIIVASCCIQYLWHYCERCAVLWTCFQDLPSMCQYHECKHCAAHYIWGPVRRYIVRCVCSVWALQMFSAPTVSLANQINLTTGIYPFVCNISRLHAATYVMVRDAESCGFLWCSLSVSEVRHCALQVWRWCWWHSQGSFPCSSSRLAHPHLRRSGGGCERRNLSFESSNDRMGWVTGFQHEQIPIHKGNTVGQKRRPAGSCSTRQKKHFGCKMIGHSRKGMSLLIEKEYISWPIYDYLIIYISVPCRLLKSQNIPEFHMFSVFGWETVRSLRQNLS